MTVDAQNILVALMTILLGLSTWTLVTVHGLSKDAAAAAEKEKAQDNSLEEDRARIIECETKIGGLQISVAKLEAKQ